MVLATLPGYYDSGTLSVVSDNGPDISTVVGLEDIQKAFVQLQKQEVCKAPLVLKSKQIELFWTFYPKSL